MLSPMATIIVVVSLVGTGFVGSRGSGVGVARGSVGSGVEVERGLGAGVGVALAISPPVIKVSVPKSGSISNAALLKI